MVVFYFFWVLYYYIYVGVLDVYIVYYFGGYGNLFYKLYILKYFKLLVEEVFERDMIIGEKNLIKLERDFIYNRKVVVYDIKYRIVLKLKIKKFGS